MADIILLTGGKPHQGWKEVVVDRSMENGAWAFELLMTENWGGGNVRPIIAGQSCQVKLDNELLITGNIDSAAPEHDKKTHSIRVRGRSKTADLIDCSTTGKEFNNRSLAQIAHTLCAPFGITVLDTAQANRAFKKVRIAAGQTIYEFLEYLSRIRAVRLIPTPEGNLLITRTGTGFLPTAMKLGENIEAAKGRVDHTQTFSEYTVLAQQEGLTFSAQASAHPKGVASDGRITRHRPTVVQSDSPMDISGCDIRARWMRNTQFGRGRSGTITVSGWQQTLGGGSWVPNNLVHVDDSEIGIVGKRLLVRSRMTLDKDGTRTENTVMPAEAFQLTELPEPESTEVFG